MKLAYGPTMSKLLHLAQRAKDGMGCPLTQVGLSLLCQI